MDSLASYFFWHNWQQKLFAVCAAIIIWFFIGHSITETKTIRNVPIRISNLPSDKTIVGLLPNGILNKRINLSLSGSKDIIDEIEPGDVEVNVDASLIDHADWIVQINKKNLVSLNPNIDIASNINSVTRTEFVIKLNRLVTAKIPVRVIMPIGDPPQGYEFLDIWPHKLMQSVSGPEEEIIRLQAKGLQVLFDLNEISKAELDAIKSQFHSGSNNEISFPVPQKWKYVTIPFRNRAVEEINDPEAQYMRIDFLRQEFLPINRKLPVRIFYSAQHLPTINPTTVKLGKSPQLSVVNDVSLFQPSLFVKNVSRLFLDIVRDYLAIDIVAPQQMDFSPLIWSLDVVSAKKFEDTFVAYQIANSSHNKQQAGSLVRKKEMLYRNRFRDYIQKLSLYLSQDHKLNIESSIKDGLIEITDY